MSGYYHREATSSLQVEDPAILNDMENPKSSSTIYGYLYEELLIRYTEGRRPFTIISCDNMPENVDTLRLSLIAFAKLKNTKVEDWIDRNARVPNSMIDWVTPKMTDEDRAYSTTILEGRR